jgi:hypothetical protein
MRSSPHLPRRGLTGALALVLAGSVLPGGAAPAGGPVRPQLPPSPREVYDPDQATCQADHLQSRFHEQLRPWSDQPEAVQARLRALQAEMLRATLRRCVGRGLLSPAEAAALQQRLGVAEPTVAPAAGGASQPSGQRP